MQVYRDLVKDYPTFRERSETPDVSFEISLQPWRAYGTDGVILFSDILTPLPGMGIDFDIIESKGPQIGDPIRNLAQVEAERLVFKNCLVNYSSKNSFDARGGLQFTI